MLRRRLEQLFQPFRFGEGVRIEKGHPFAIHRLLYAQVVGRGEPGVAFQPDDFQRKRLAFDGRQGVVGTDVVDEPDTVGQARLATQRGKTTSEMAPGVVIDDDDRNRIRVHTRLFQGVCLRQCSKTSSG